MHLVLLPLLALVFLFLEIGIGGARLVYTVPAVCTLAVAGVLAALRPLPMRGKPSTWCLGTALVFGAYILVRNRLSEIDHLARLQFYIMAGCLIVYLLTALFLPDSRHRKALLVVLLALAVAQVLLGFYQFARVNAWMPLPWAQRRDDWWRASGFFISPNHFAGYLEILFFAAASFAVWGRGKAAGRILMAYAALVCVVGVAISGSRGGYLSVIFGGLVFFGLSLVASYHLRREAFPKIAIVSTLAAVLVAGGLFLTMFQSTTLLLRFQAINDPENMRFLLWDSALEQFMLSPWFGTGGFSFFYFGRLFRNPLVQNDPIHVHNDYLQLLADYGLAGVVLFGALYLAHAAAGWQGFRRRLRAMRSHAETQSDSLALAIAGLCVLAAYTVHSVVDFNMHLTVNALLVAFFLACLTSAVRAPGQSKNPGRLALLQRFVLPAGSIALLVHATPFIRSEYLSERARVALRDGHPSEALTLASDGLAIDAANPDLWFYAGEAARMLAWEDDAGRRALLQKSIESFTAGLRVFPYDSRLALKLAQTYSESGDYDTAAAFIDLAESLDPQSGLVFAFRGMIELAAGYIEDARAAFEDALALGGQGGDMARQGLQLAAEAEKNGLQPRSLLPPILLPDNPVKTESPILPEPEPGGVSDGTVQ